MHTRSKLFAVLGVFACTLLLVAQRDSNVARQTRLFNGWGLSPAGNAIELTGDMPARILVSPDGKYLFVNTTGFNELGVSVIDLASRKVVQKVDLLKSWIGLAMLDGRRMVASGGGPMPEEPKSWGAAVSAGRFANVSKIRPICSLNGAAVNFRSGRASRSRPPLGRRALFRASLRDAKAIFTSPMQRMTLFSGCRRTIFECWGPRR